MEQTGPEAPGRDDARRPVSSSGEEALRIHTPATPLPRLFHAIPLEWGHHNPAERMTEGYLGEGDIDEEMGI